MRMNSMTKKRNKKISRTLLIRSKNITKDSSLKWLTLISMKMIVSLMSKSSKKIEPTCSISLHQKKQMKSSISNNLYKVTLSTSILDIHDNNKQYYDYVISQLNEQDLKVLAKNFKESREQFAQYLKNQEEEKANKIN